MIIAIDFDGTFNSDPEAFTQLVHIFTNCGHTPILVTQRQENKGKAVKRVVKDLIPIIWAGGMTKRDAALRDGYNVDIWIDDNPGSVDTVLLYVGEDL